MLLFFFFLMQMSLAIKKILYAADAKGSALDEAQEYLNDVINGGEDEAEAEAEAEVETEAWLWLLLQIDPGWSLLNKLSFICDDWDW